MPIARDQWRARAGQDRAVASDGREIADARILARVGDDEDVVLLDAELAEALVPVAGEVATVEGGRPLVLVADQEDGDVWDLEHPRGEVLEPVDEWLRCRVEGGQAP